MARRIGPGGPFLVGQINTDNTQIMPFVPVDFPPPAPARQRGAIDVAVSLLLTTLAVVTAVQNVVIRDPLYSVAGRAKSAPEWQIPPNLLTTTLVPVAVATPFAPVDLPLNRRVVNVPQFDPARNISVLQLQAAPFKPVDLPLSRKALQVSQFDPPNVLINIPVVAGTPFYAPYVTPIQGAVRQVLGFDPPNVTINLPTTAAAPFKPYDWTSPGRARALPQFEAPNLALTLPTTLHPFIPTEWTLSGVKQQVGPFEPPNLLVTTLALAPPTPPFVVNFDWRPTQNPWQPFLDTIPNLLTSTFNPTSPVVEPDVVPPSGAGRRHKGKRPPYWWERQEETPIPVLPEFVVPPDPVPVSMDVMPPRVAFSATPDLEKRKRELMLTKALAALLADDDE